MTAGVLWIQTAELQMALYPYMMGTVEHALASFGVSAGRTVFGHFMYDQWVWVPNATPSKSQAVLRGLLASV